uniref:Uncharacterized protein n=1 Tax=Molossus molossus TaxID=27622 RepID=A0A7J8F927_MOLMO|nr:hypothetical protein HJG59_008475 [Molossus molossus]
MITYSLAGQTRPPPCTFPSAPSPAGLKAGLPAGFLQALSTMLVLALKWLRSLQLSRCVLVQISGRGSVLLPSLPSLRFSPSEVRRLALLLVSPGASAVGHRFFHASPQKRRHVSKRRKQNIPQTSRLNTPIHTYIYYDV